MCRHDIRGFARSCGGGRGVGGVRAGGGRSVWDQHQPIRWAQRLQEEGHAQARAMGGDQRSRLVEHRAAVLELVAQHPDLTLQEIRSALATGQGISVGLTSLWRFLKAQKITLTKRAYTPPSGSAPM
jgi:transposase